VPLQTIALQALEQQPANRWSALVFPAERNSYLDLHNFRNREWVRALLTKATTDLDLGTHSRGHALAHVVT
jgi:hypothetical protein